MLPRDYAMKMSSAVHSVFFAAAICVSAVLVLSGVFSADGCLWICLLLYTALLALAWRTFGGGRHPCFLFLGMLLLFQMGRLVGYALGATKDPFNVVLATLIPITVSPATSEMTMLLVLLSALIVYAVCAWNAPTVVLHPGDELFWLPACYVLLAASFPFVLYKNYVYFQFIRDHGGYLAIFTDSDSVTQSAGALVRAMSLLAANAFLLVYLIERRRGRLAVVTSIYLSTSVLELLIGLRGKVFLFLLTLWFLHNLKTGKHFRLVTLATVALIGSFAAVAISGFREMRTTAVTGPGAFIASQGTSMGVTQMAIEYRPLFAPHAKTYLISELLQAYYPSSHFGQGELFDNDLTVFLNVDAYRQGYGTGSSYLAEAWVVGGLPFVMIVSVLIGLVLRLVHRLGARFSGAVAIAIMLPNIIYLPRDQLLRPVAMSLKSGLVFLLILPLLGLIRWLLYDPPASPSAE
jgi:hypothetical protein